MQGVEDGSGAALSKEGCAERVRSLRREGQITPEFETKFLEWFQKKSSSRALSVMSMYIESHGKDYRRLAKSLMNDFSVVL